MRIELAMMFTKVRSLDRSDIRHSGAYSSGNEAMITKCSIGRIDSHPAGAGKKNINPCVQTTLRSPVLDVHMEFAEKTAHPPDRQADLTEDGRAKERGIPAGARSQFDSARR